VDGDAGDAREVLDAVAVLDLRAVATSSSYGAATADINIGIMRTVTGKVSFTTRSAAV